MQTSDERPVYAPSSRCFGATGTYFLFKIFFTFCFFFHCRIQSLFDHKFLGKCFFINICDQKVTNSCSQKKQKNSQLFKVFFSIWGKNVFFLQDRHVGSKLQISWTDRGVMITFISRGCTDFKILPRSNPRTVSSSP